MGATIYGVLKTNMQKRLKEIPDEVTALKSGCMEEVKKLRGNRDKAIAGLVQEVKDIEHVLGTGRVDSDPEPAASPEPAAPVAAGEEEGGGDE